MRATPARGLALSSGDAIDPMYLEYYGLKEPPFSITPDPRFVFLSDRHRDALAHLLYGIGQGGGGGFVQLTGEVGTGKTTLCRLLLEQLPENTRVALVLNPRVSPLELLETLCEELRVEIEGRRGSLKGLVDALNAYLLDAYAQGLRVVLIVDEAQDLSEDALEQVRLLTNLETPTQKLLQIILLGQPELREMLARPELRQLAQRITARYHLTPLDAEETEAYVRHRLSVAGCQRFPFTKLALRKIHQHSGGVPRLINVIADRALVAGYARELGQIGERAVDQAAAEALAGPIRGIQVPRWVYAVAATAVIAGVGVWLVGPVAEDEPVLAAVVAGDAEAPPEPAPEATTGPIGREGLRQRIVEAGPSRLTAWNQLLSLWMLRADTADVRSAAECPPVLAPGVYCLRGSGSLTKLATLRRPVVLRLSAAGHDAWAVLQGIDEETVRLAIGGESFDTGWRELESAWLGEFHAVFRAPEFMSGTVRRGEAGAPVEWLEAMLGANTRRADPVGPAYFDAEIEADVRSLQAAHGLVPDGIVGPETLLAIAARERGGPRLRRSLD
ncbi:MAG TPA: AAA family ATPase [Xanthomonadaceae bacterium]|nr:AAA family ATPase [Xanthomonadaceae bacterium]